ncbi:bifunctional [glutamine synthetase] adenylyltransferase/[glutamine synthetase]-adenylyl-L-tyrosine phosphorylase [Kineosporia babensis]|uniref:Bifunctional glutamine synthetase adenylyltransferase/adenylyl-removing enzyme n=1 Tax=Kineosporia babensis TaxID=499548 RepID=A0A9X1SUD7_9ACTN|nr:bifunctional [glutamine synthetase] adenylyltransferase/[glutamine synthetase]-adenylyl-L-tyrosine phosphorylase [Kineosporia babensis]
MTTARQASFAARLARFGFADPAAAEQVLSAPVMGELRAGPTDEKLLSALADSPDPDLALAALGRLAESMSTGGRAEAGLGGLTTQALQSLGEGSAVAQLGDALHRDDLTARRLFAVLGGSAALGDHLVRHPRQWPVIDGELGGDDLPPGPANPSSDFEADHHGHAREFLEGVPPRPFSSFTADQMRSELLQAVGADPTAAMPVGELPQDEATDALRVAYRRRLLGLAARDLAADNPLAILPTVAAILADLAAAALEAALAVARGSLPGHGKDCRLAVIGMGKCGGRELNYVSDVDVIYVVEAVEGADEHKAITEGTRLASTLGLVCSKATPEGTLWPVDPNLRPEGRQGPLVRTLASHLTYYERWAKTWEFQALLKARLVAGDADLGARYLAGIEPMVWKAAERENFVADVQAMRRRVEETLKGPDADRELKLGAGGLRDVEFSVQLLQLVHGRIDARLRTPNTLLGLEALSTFGYVGRADAAELDRAYRMLRALEHRIQLFRLQRTHVVPSGEADLRRLGREFGFRANAGEGLSALWRKQAREVRRLHEKLFYRPLLAAAAELTSDEARLTPEAARVRLAALGYRDPAGAMRHLTALTLGVSRRAAIQRQLLPVMLGWFADGADPDAGLLDFRRLSEALGSTHWYLKMLRDSGAAAERLAHVLSSSQLVAELLQRAPEAVALLETDEVLQPQPLSSMIAGVRKGAARHEGDPVAAVMAARAVRRREIIRTGVADVVGLSDIDSVGRALSDCAIAAVDGALVAAADSVRAKRGDLPVRMAVIAMGRLGGRELSYSSDADVMFVADPLPGVDPHEAQAAATDLCSELRRLLSMTGPEPALAVDANLRPEGRNGPLVRSLASYRDYYARWSVAWEAQALTRALPIAGEKDLGAEFIELIDPLRWRPGGLPDASLKEIRRIKARVESERLPRGADPHRHLKLGRGALADVEWTVQLYQLQHAHEIPELRVTGTMEALAAAVGAGLISAEDGEVLAEAWRLAARFRNAIMLWKGNASDVPPTNHTSLDGVARIMGYPPGSAGRLDDDYQRVTRRARTVVERLFYGWDV